MLVEVDIHILNWEAIHGARNEICCILIDFYRKLTCFFLEPAPLTLNSVTVIEDEGLPLAIFF